MPTDAFAILDIAPTRELGVVKRAYFAALTRHPPHADPEGFRRVRDAYERLSTPLALAAAFASAPLELEALATDYRARFDARLAAAARAHAEAASVEAGAQHFTTRFSGLSWDEALQALPR
jgi:hypothetical protein